MDIAVDLNSTTPLYLQIRDAIVRAIAQGELAPGDRLSSVRSLAAGFGINPATVVKAYDLLREQGFIVTDSRTGSTVAPHPDSGLEQWREQVRVVVAEGVARGLDAAAMAREIKSVLAEFGGSST